jgi:uncharacterized repeat protein (TIGR01451 family)
MAGAYGGARGQEQAMRTWRLAFVFVLFAVPASAQTYDLSWYTVDGGGATFSAGGAYSLGATIGQADASGALTGGSYSVVGGFWAGSLSVPEPEGSVDLTLSLADAPDPVTGNQTLTYTLSVVNNGPDTASLVTLTHALPSGAVFQSLTGPGWTCGEASGVVTCTRSNLSVGSAPNVVVQVTAPPGGGTLQSDASVTSSPETEADPVDNSASASTTVTGIPYADVAIVKTDGGVTAHWNRTLTYTLTASNAGPHAVSGATVSDSFHPSLTGVTWTCAASAGSSCAPSGSGNISSSVSLLVGGTATYTARGTVVWGTAGPIPNTASIASPIFDPAAANNSSSIDTPVNTDLIFGDGFESVP